MNKFIKDNYADLSAIIVLSLLSFYMLFVGVNALIHHHSLPIIPLMLITIGVGIICFNIFMVRRMYK